MTNAVNTAPTIDLVIEGGGVLGAFADGCMDVLLPHVEVATLSGTSAGMTTSLRVLWAQARALEAIGKNEGENFRGTSARFFDKATTHMWNNACIAANFVNNAELMASPMTFFMPQAMQDQAKMHLWQMQSDSAEHLGNSSNSFLNLLHATLPCIAQDLANPQLARLVTNSVNVKTGEEILTQTRTLDGEQLPPNLAMHAASGIVPPFFAAIDGVYIDGAFRRNGPVQGAIAERGDTPVLRIGLGKPDFKAYQSLYQSHAQLCDRAREAFDFVGESLPTDRPTAEICYPHGKAERGLILLPTSGEVKRLRALGQETMQAELDRGLLQQLQPRAAKLRLAA